MRENIMALSDEIIDRLMGTDIPTVEEIEAKYPPRKLADGQCVTRIAPSPTGFMHLGSVYAALISERVAHQSGGVFMLRIEDTDTKREVEGAAEFIITALADFGLKFDEGPLNDHEEVGNYGPYVQSKRKEIYQAYIKDWLKKGLAYPCFCSEDEINAMRERQTKAGGRPGYYGMWAKCRNLTEEQVKANLDAGKPFVIRFKSPGKYINKIAIEDVCRGKRFFPENDLDIIIMKSDKLPTYHFAHLIDDHLMGTTHVLRGDEWLSSLPLHIQLFQVMGWNPPKYGHIAPIQKLEDEARRKLSKRKDPEANIAFYGEKGYPKEVVIDYLMNLANSDFEDFKRDNPSKTYLDFELKIERLNNSGPLLDFVKLENISKEFMATLSAEELYARLYEWAEKYDAVLKQKMDTNSAYFKQILNIERGNCERVRKDFYMFSAIYPEIKYFFDDEFSLSAEEALSQLANLPKEDVKFIADTYLNLYNPNDTKDEWFAKIKEFALANGYAKNVKEITKNPDVKYKGTVSDVATVLRVLMTGRRESPDLYSIMQVLGPERVVQRLKLLA